MKTVMIVAGESSGELYGSRLAKALRSLWPDMRLVGVGGERMRDAGVEILSGISSALGITEVLQSVWRLRESFRRASRALTEISPGALVLIDYPEFNFRLARIAKRRGIKVLYYVSPQVWAWRKGRVKTMKEIADSVAVILPFEEEIYRKAGVACEFVGHPVMEEIEEYELTGQKPEVISHKMEGKVRGPVISLLPGSRPNELKTLLPVFIRTVRMFREDSSDARFVLPLAPNLEPERFGEHLGALQSMGVELSREGAVKALSSSDLAVIASGTATLQAALLGIPTVVVYRVSPLTYAIGKRVLKVRHISLANIIAGREVVPELIQRRANEKNIMQECRKILYDDTYRETMVASLGKVRESFAGKRPSRRVAEMTGEMSGW